MRKEAAHAHDRADRLAAPTASATARMAGARMAPAVAALLFAEIAFAQLPSGSVLEPQPPLQAGDRTTPSETAPPAPSTPLEALVNPETYRLFSGDELQLGIWGEIPRTFLLTVGPEGDLVLPGKGPLRVGGLTLREAEEAVVVTMRPIYGQARLTLRLTRQARIRIMVTGMVAKPGIYEVTGADRLSSLLELAGGVRPGGSLRRIEVRSSDDPGGRGAPREIDMLPWSLRGEIDSNPFLERGMRVEVPAQGSAVRIRGPVLSRGALQTPVAAAVRVGDRPEEEPDLLVEMRLGDTVGLLLDQVGGLSDRATGRGTLQRGNEPPRVLDLSSPDGRSLLLRPDDVLEVEYAMRWVFVTGSVRSPGRFPYLPGLGAHDYVSLAGGPTEIGRTSGWTIERPDGTRQPVKHAGPVLPGSTLRVPEQRSYKTTTWLSPLSTATALLISIVALTRR
jgi:protein involved in polysaccharide export with SLBB domain